MRAVVVGDHFVPAGCHADFLAELGGPRGGPVRSVEWSGTRADQHAAQQAMEWHGPEAAPVPGENRERPDPQLFLKACADLDTDPRATLMVGDNPIRDGGAAACGLRTYISPSEPRTGERGLTGVLRLGT